jgi:hypothetical protein
MEANDPGRQPDCRMREMMRDMIVIKQRNGDKAITDYFTDEFMQEYTNFHSFKEFTFSSIVWIDWSQNVVITRESLLDRFVAGSSVFETWHEMFEKAKEEYKERSQQ